MGDAEREAGPEMTSAKQMVGWLVLSLLIGFVGAAALDPLDRSTCCHPRFHVDNSACFGGRCPGVGVASEGHGGR